MKIRIRGNSIRLRLTQSEVSAVAGRGDVGETTAFADGAQFQYRLAGEDGIDGCQASFADGCLTVRVPAARLHDWACSEAVTIEDFQDLGGDETLRILVEKDFACLADRPHEDDSDAFPHPESD